MTTPLRLVFLGSDAIARPLLDWLVSDVGRAQVEVVGVFTQPDRPVGRGQKITANEIKTWAIGRGLPVFQPEKITDEVRAQLAALTPDLSLVMAYGHILRDAFIATPRLGTLNLHTSLLPQYRGASPIQTAIASGERQTGVTLMQIVRELDAGPLADFERVKIEPLDTALDTWPSNAAAAANGRLEGLSEGAYLLPILPAVSPSVRGPKAAPILLPKPRRALPALSPPLAASEDLPPLPLPRPKAIRESVVTTAIHPASRQPAASRTGMSRSASVPAVLNMAR
jgi:folate-dependent phosphoribosylglycinamide formyltransferase PurN